jgi:hypothetical protein
VSANSTISIIFRGALRFFADFGGSIALSWAERFWDPIVNSTTTPIPPLTGGAIPTPGIDGMKDCGKGTVFGSPQQQDPEKKGREEC